MKQDFEQNQEEALFSSGNLFLLSIGSLLLYGLVALLVFYYVLGYSPAWSFEHGLSVEKQLLIGGIAGCIGAFMIFFCISRSPIKEVLDDFYIVRILSRAQLSWFDRLQVSIFAGIGEEFLFRGALQPWLGIWLASLIFVGLHGYFKFKSAGHLLFGILFFGLSMILGWLFEYAGLIAAMAAHAVYDILMLHWIQKKPVIKMTGF